MGPGINLALNHCKGGRWVQVFRHTLGQSQALDTLVHHEPSEDCFLSLTKTKDGRLILINSNSKTSSVVILAAPGFQQCHACSEPHCLMAVKI